MNSRVLVAFAMKQELAPWRRRHQFLPLSASPYFAAMAAIGAADVYVAVAGAGAPDAAHFDLLSGKFSPSLAIVTGVAAGLRPEWRPGDLLAAQAVTGPDQAGGIRSAAKWVDHAVQCGAKRAGTLVTLPRIARTPAEKKTWAPIADAADMESLPLMKQWQERGIPSLALRVILDPVETPMTCDFEAAMDLHGQVKITRLMAQLGRRPQLLPDFLRLAWQSRRALRLLARFLDRFFETSPREER